ncbi:MAG: hypothetical protein H7246_17170 [Phycisphaerae bacterium]|nr:hypothetical protein [Saprospiraceae bacterium]
MDFALGLQIVILTLIPSFVANLSRYNPMRISYTEGASRQGWPFLFSKTGLQTSDEKARVANYNFEAL